MGCVMNQSNHREMTDCQDVIAGLAVFHMQLPVRSVRKHGVGDVTNGVDVIYVAIATADGVVGWGEASPWAVFTGTAEANAAALDRYLRPVLVGRKIQDIPAIMADCDRAVAGNWEAKAALESALLDCLGKRIGQPAHMFLGGLAQEKIPLSISLADPDLDADLDLLDRVSDDNLGLIKVKTGFGEHAFDLKRLEAFRKRRPDIDLRIDYNQGLDPFGALAKLRDVEVFQPTFIEQPVRAHLWAVLSELTAATDTPILADESVYSLADLVSAMEQKIANGVSVKIMKSGGPRAGQAIAQAADANGWGVYSGDMFETGLAHRAGLHMVAATPAFRLGCEFYQSRYYLVHDPIVEPLGLENGHLCIPKTPGLGATVDSDIIARFTVTRMGDDLPDE